MFNVNHSQSDNNSNDKNIKSDFLNFSSNKTKDEFFDELSSGNKFVSDDINLRNMVVDMLQKEFGENIKNIKGYDYLVESVINNIKKKQNDTMSVCIED